MTERTKYQNGEFCWTELSTSDVSAAKTFYSSLFGWEIDDQELPEGMGTYTTFNVRGKAVAAATPQRPDEAGIPSHWNLYMSVDDVDTFTKNAESAGGTVIAQPFDVMELGRMSVIADPTGGMLGLWQPMTMPGAAIESETGAFVWPELMTADVAKAESFYKEAFGYDSETVEMPDSPPYTMLKVSDKNVAGLMAPPAEGLPTVWVPYYQVDDCAATEAKVKELGGSVMMPTTDVPGVGSLAWFTDPTGGTFAVLQPAPEPQQ